MNITKLEAQFIKDLFEAAVQGPWQEDENWVNQIGSIIEDIWDAPESWPEYDEFFGVQRDPEQVRKELINILPKWGIPIEDWMKPYLITP